MTSRVSDDQQARVFSERGLEGLSDALDDDEPLRRCIGWRPRAPSTT
jgi:hypothetical protein